MAARQYHYIDLSQPDGIPRLVESPGIAAPISSLTRKRGTAPPMGVQFIQDGEPVDPGEIELTFMVKEIGKYDGEPVVTHSGDDWTTPGSVAGFYEGAPSYNTTELNAQMLSPDGNAANDVASKIFMCAYSWREGVGTPSETEEIPLVVWNKVVNGDEGVPTEAAPDVAARLSALEALAGIDGAAAWPDTAFVSTDGDDGAAQIGSIFLPYETVQAAFDAGAKSLFLFPRTGSYAGITTTDPVDLTIIAIAAGTNAGTITTPAAVTIRGNGAELVTLSITTTPAAETIVPGVAAGNVDVRGCTIGTLLAEGGSTTAAGENGGNGGAVTLRRCDVTGLISLAGGSGGAGGSSGTIGSLQASYCKFTLTPDTGSFELCIAALKLLDNTTATLRNKTLGGGCVVPFELTLAAGDEVTSCTTGAGKVTFRMPFGAILTEARASLKVAPQGAIFIVDINKNGASILSTKLSIDTGEKTSVTASAPAVISDDALGDDDEITIDIDQVGSSVAGVAPKITLIGTRVLA